MTYHVHHLDSEHLAALEERQAFINNKTWPWSAPKLHSSTIIKPMAKPSERKYLQDPFHETKHVPIGVTCIGFLVHLLSYMVYGFLGFNLMMLLLFSLSFFLILGGSLWWLWLQTQTLHVEYKPKRIIMIRHGESEGNGKKE